MPVPTQQTVDAQSRGAGGDGWKWGAACKLRFGWVSCEGLGGQQAGEHRGENFASLCRLMTRAGVSDQEARAPVARGGWRPEQSGASLLGRSGTTLCLACPGLNFQPLLFKVPKRKKCVCGGEGGAEREGVVFMPIASFA